MGVAEADTGSGVITVKAIIYCYGDAADTSIAQKIGDDISRSWSEPAVFLPLLGESFRVQFNIAGIYSPALTPGEVIGNVNPYYNYFRIEEVASGDISFVDGIRSNTGYFKKGNIINESTTAAHEFGHTLGLFHPDILDIRHMGRPGIMYPRGTLTSPEFQYDPAAPAGTVGGTLNPVHRKVLPQDVEMLRLGELNYVNNKAIVGAFSSVWHDKHS